MTTPSNGEKSLGQIYQDSRVNEESHDEALQAVASHAIATSPLVKQLVAALEHIQNKSLHIVPATEIAGKALSSYRAAMGKERE